MTSKEYNATLAILKQNEYCEKNEHPCFAPNDGVCWKCHRNIYEPYKRPNGTVTGITVEQASARLIADCPHCNKSYCD